LLIGELLRRTKRKANNWWKKRYDDKYYFDEDIRIEKEIRKLKNESNKKRS
jgi:hypothetical protein